MLDYYIEEVKNQLYNLLDQEGAEFSYGEILMLSQKLDKLILVKQSILIKRSETNYFKQLHNLLSPKLFAEVVA
jgi:hypothetical protein